MNPLQKHTFADPFSMLRHIARSVEAPNRATFPAVNIWQGNDAVAVTAELPGFDLENIEISAKENALTISGDNRPSKKSEDASWHLNERRFGNFNRSIRLPFRVDPNEVNARFVNGVLQIALQRPKEDKPRRIEVKAA